MGRSEFAETGGHARSGGGMQAQSIIYKFNIDP